jgi:hypothetical protein
MAARPDPPPTPADARRPAGRGATTIGTAALCLGTGGVALLLGGAAVRWHSRVAVRGAATAPPTVGNVGLRVAGNVNRSEGDPDPLTWEPSVTSYRCSYARMWIRVKYYYGLTLQSLQRSALRTMLDNC